MKHREGSAGADLGAGRLADQGKSIRTPSGGGMGRMPDGLFDSFYPREKAAWLHISPHQSWDQFVYDRDSSTVIKVRRTWFQTTKHYHPRSKRSLICSAGPHRTEPCYPDAIRRAHWAEMNAIEERTGIKPADEAPVSVGNQFSFSIVVMENILALPLRDKKSGEIRKSKSGKVLYKYVPEPFVDPIDRANVTKVFGHRFHFSLGKRQLLQMLKFDEEMMNYCKQCATGLTADAVICPDCEAAYALPGLVGGEDLVDTREVTFNCEKCSYEGPMQPLLACSGCGKPEEGRLTDFDIRLKKEKVDENSSILKIVGVRKPLSTIRDEATRDRLEKFIMSPLDLPAIFAPTSLQDQKRILGDLCQNIDPRQPKKDEEEPSHGAQEGDTEDYGGAEDADIPF